MSDRPSACHSTVVCDKSAPQSPTQAPLTDNAACIHSRLASLPEPPQLPPLLDEPPSAGAHSNERPSTPSSEAAKVAGLTAASSHTRWLRYFRRFGPVGGTALVLAAHAVHLLALPLLAAWLGLNAASPDAGAALLAGHSGHAGHAGSGSLPMRWATDLLAAATVAAAISMCGAMTRSWRNVRQHPLACIVYTIAAMLCIGMILI